MERKAQVRILAKKRHQLIETTLGTVNDDVLALLDPNFKRTNFCNIILNF